MLKVVGASWHQTRVITGTLVAMVAIGIVIYIFGENYQLEEDGIYSATVYYSENSGFHVSYWGQGKELAHIPKGVARAYYKTDISNNGWAFFEIQSNQNSPDWHQAFSAGVLEGGLTWQHIYWHWYNTVRFACDNKRKFCDQVRQFLRENWEWTTRTAEELQSVDSFWHQVHLYIMQLKGLEHGFKCGVERSREEFEIPSEDFIWMNAVSDFPELEQKFNSSFGNRFGYSNIGSFSSAFVKLLPRSRRLIVAHNTGGMYQAMQRIMKRYELHYHTVDAPNASEIPGKIVTFSSYPAVLFSQDEFYSVSGSKGKVRHLVITGTAIKNNNFELWDYINSTGQVLLGPRVMSANRLATSGYTWGVNLIRYNSGTGNKQWLVGDYSRLHFRKSLGKQTNLRHRLKHTHRKPKGLLWVWEQYPGTYKFCDQTRHLYAASYWAALGGVPFHKDLLALGHLNKLEKEHGPLFLATNSPIATVFRKYHSTATDTASTFSLMRSTKYIKDPISNKNTFVAIAPRADLSDSDPHPAGVIDTKVIAGDSDTFEMQALSGPSVSSSFRDDGDDDDDDVKKYIAYYQRKPLPFKWSKSKFSNLFHLGQPDTWHFNVIKIKWIWSIDDKESE